MSSSGPGRFGANIYLEVDCQGFVEKGRRGSLPIEDTRSQKSIPGRVLSMPDDLVRLGLGRPDFEAGLERLDRFLSAL